KDMPRRAGTAADPCPHDKAPARSTQGPPAPDFAPPSEIDAVPPESLRSALDLDLLERGPRVDDVPLELQLRLLDAGGDADELSEVEDGHLELPAGRGLELRL